jgi:hypothetical protein
MRFILSSFQWLLAASLFLCGCQMDYGMKSRLAMEDMPQGMQLTEYRDCTEVVGDRYWYSDHELGVDLLYSGCLERNYKAYLMIEHQYEQMDMARTEARYTTSNNDQIIVDAAQFTLDMWYNPVDIELQIVPYSGDVALGIHEFYLDCQDDDDRRCRLEYLGAVRPENLR